MSATITIQFVERATAHRLSDDMASVELVMGSGDSGYGGSVGIVLRTQEEARLLLNAASQALSLLPDITAADGKCPCDSADYATGDCPIHDTKDTP